MAFRYQRFSTFYSQHLETFYRTHPEIVDAPYEQHRQVLWDDGFNWMHYLGRELRNLGYETSDIGANVEPLQRQWAHEHGLDIGEDVDWYHEIALAQIKDFKPDILFAPFFEPEFIQHCREECPSIRLIIGWAGEPNRDANFFRNHDLMLTCVPEHVTYYRDAGIHAEHLLHAFEPSVLDRVQSSTAKIIPFGFIGSVQWGDYAHNQRALFLYELSQRTNLTLYSSVPDLISGYFAGNWKAPIQRVYYHVLLLLRDMGLDKIADTLPYANVAARFGERLPYAGAFQALAQLAREPVFGMEMYQVLHNMRIALNQHAWSDFASNMRLFEATGMGTCLLTDAKQNLNELFAVGTDIVTYQNVTECAEQVDYLLNHPAEADAIAKRGQARTLSAHTTSHRAYEFDSLVSQHMP